MKFTEKRYPRYAIRVSGKLATMPSGDSGDPAIVYFANRQLADEWLRDELGDCGEIIELLLPSWWHTVLESPHVQYLAVALDSGSAGTAIIEVGEVLKAYIDFSKNGEVLSAIDFSELSAEERSKLFAALAADTNPHLKKLLEKVRVDMESLGTITPAVFGVGGHSRVDYLNYPKFDELHKNVAADLMVTLVREGHFAVGLVAATTEAEANQDIHELRFASRPCKPRSICVVYEQEGLALRGIAKVGDRNTLSNWFFEHTVAGDGRFCGIFEKAIMLGPAPTTSDALAKEMREDLARLARSKGITHEIPFVDLMRYCNPSEIERLARKWTWQSSKLRDVGTGSLDDLPWNFWNSTIDPTIPLPDDQ